MAAKFIQGNNAGSGQSSSGGASNTYSLAFTAQNTGAGNLLCVAFSAVNSGVTLSGVTDNQGNPAYTVFGPYANGTTSLWFAFCLNTAGGTKASIKLTFAGTSVVTGISPVIAEYQGVDSYRTNDGGNTGTGDNPVSGNVTTNIGDLIIGYCQDTAGMTTFAAGTGYTLRESSVITTSTFCALEEAAAGVIGGGVTTAGFTSGTSTAWSAGAAVFYKSSPVIQTASSATGGNTNPLTLAFGNNTAAGSLLVACVRMGATGRTGVAFSDTQNNTWTTVLIGNDVNAVDTYFGYALNTAGGACTVKLAYSSTATSGVFCIGEYPVGSASALHTSATATAGATGTNPATPSISPAVGDLLIGAWNLSSVPAVSIFAGTCGASAALSGQGRSGNNLFSAFEDGIASSASSQNATLTYASSSTYAGALFAFTPTAVATPTFSPVAGTYTGTQTVTVSDTNSGLAGFAMYYTTDGSNPTTGSTLYSGPISVSTSQTLKVLAVATGYANSAIASAAYVIHASSSKQKQASAGYGTDISASAEFSTNPTGETSSTQTSIFGTNRGTRIIG